MLEMTRKAPVLFAALALALFGLTACGSDGGDETTAAQATSEAATTEAATSGGATDGGGTAEISAPADGSFAYDQTDVQVSAGKVTVNFDNPAPLSHDVVIEDSSGQEIAKTDLVSEGSASTSADLTPGTYTFYCDVPGHRDSGMEGTLTVN